MFTAVKCTHPSLSLANLNLFCLDFSKQRMKVVLHLESWAYIPNCSKWVARKEKRIQGGGGGGGGRWWRKWKRKALAHAREREREREREQNNFENCVGVRGLSYKWRVMCAQLVICTDVQVYFHVSTDAKNSYVNTFPSSHHHRAQTTERLRRKWKKEEKGKNENGKKGRACTKHTYDTVGYYICRLRLKYFSLYRTLSRCRSWSRSLLLSIHSPPRHVVQEGRNLDVQICEQWLGGRCRSS